MSFCLEGEFAELALKRGYLEFASCPSGLRPLLKRLPGQYSGFTFDVEITDSAIANCTIIE